LRPKVEAGNANHEGPVNSAQTRLTGGGIPAVSNHDAYLTALLPSNLTRQRQKQEKNPKKVLTASKFCVDS